LILSWSILEEYVLYSNVGEISLLTLRQVYTNLFPARHTWYLLGTIIILNGIDWAGFELLSIGNKDIEILPTGYRVLDGLFQALGMTIETKTTI
jgi:hypothetical protein